MKFATDKIGHGYLPSYLRIAAELGPAARVCEVGVQYGHGLDMFQALFPDGMVAGVDANPHAAWPDGTRRIICRPGRRGAAGPACSALPGVGPVRGRRVP